MELGVRAESDDWRDSSFVLTRLRVQMSSLPVLLPGLDKTARQLAVAPIPEALVPNIHVYWFKVPATREAISTDELHTDSQRDCDSEQDRQDARPIDRPVQTEGEQNREERNYIGPVSRAEAVPSPPDGILRKQQEVWDQGEQQPGDQPMSGDSRRDQWRGGQRRATQGV